MNNYTCKICHNNFNNQEYIVKEMMFGLDHHFKYFKCSSCGCLQINDVPQNLSDYYPSNYYSFSHIERVDIFKKIKMFIKRKIIKYRFYGFSLIGFLFSKYLKSFYWLDRAYCNTNSKILDIGCGNGFLINELYQLGFVNVQGLDPYAPIQKQMNDKVKIHKIGILDLDDKFDFIMLHHTFEHLENPKEILKKLYDSLNPGSCLLIRIPIVSSFAFRKYGVNWVQLDAPRHIFLHTPTSINMLARETGFKVAKVLYDSTDFQFTGSEKYQNNIPLIKNYIFKKKELRFFSKQAKLLNAIRDGDSACFYLVK